MLNRTSGITQLMCRGLEPGLGPAKPAGFSKASLPWVPSWAEGGAVVPGVFGLLVSLASPLVHCLHRLRVWGVDAPSPGIQALCQPPVSLPRSLNSLNGLLVPLPCPHLYQEQSL